MIRLLRKTSKKEIAEKFYRKTFESTNNQSNCKRP